MHYAYRGWGDQPAPGAGPRRSDASGNASGSKAPWTPPPSALAPGTARWNVAADPRHRPFAPGRPLPSPGMDGPLSDITIVDLSRVLAGPYATMVLSDLGARVIKVERPGRGDDARGFGPFYGGRSVYFESLNRGKSATALDLGVPDDRKEFEQLLDGADVLVENFRPGTLDRMGYGWEVLHARWPRLVYAAVSGFGRTGPYSDNEPRIRHGRCRPTLRRLMSPTRSEHPVMSANPQTVRHHRPRRCGHSQIGRFGPRPHRGWSCASFRP